jgi:HK97 family phage portal protein
MSLPTFFKGLQNLWVGTEESYINNIPPTTVNGNALFNEENADKISTVYACIKILSETLSRVPLNLYSEDIIGNKPIDKNDYRYPLLHYKPNAWTSQQTFFASLEYWRNLKGNSFARINRDNNGKITSLVLISPSKVTNYKVTNGQLFYEIENDKGLKEIIKSEDILHFRSLTKDGIWGINPIAALRLNLSTTYQGLNTLDNFYRNNAASPKAIKLTSNGGAGQQKLLESLEDFKRKYSGSVNAGQILPLPANTEIIDLALNYEDAQFIETLKWNITQIGSLYGVPPHLLGVLESSKFNNVEMMMLDFKVNTLASIARMYRQELESKLLTTQERIDGKSIEFNLDALLEADSTTRINNLKTLANMGIISINDIARLEGWPTYPDGDIHLVPSNYVTVGSIKSKEDLQNQITQNKPNNSK